MNNGAAETRDDDLLKQKEEEMIRYLTTLQSFIRENSNLSKKKSMNEIEGNSKETPSLKSKSQSSFTVSSMPDESKETKRAKTDDGSMMKSVASSVQSNKKAEFNSTFKKSIHKVGITNIMGRSLGLICAVYLSVLVVGAIYVGVRVGLLSRMPVLIQEHLYINKLVYASSSLNRFVMISNLMPGSNASEKYTEGDNRNLYVAKDNSDLLEVIIREYGELTKSKARSIWDNTLSYKLNNQTVLSLSLGSAYLQIISKYRQISADEIDPLISATNTAAIFLKSQEIGSSFDDQTSSLLKVSLYLFIASIISMIVITAVLVWVFVHISREIEDFFSKCSVIFDRLDQNLLENELNNLEAGLLAEEKIFEKACVFASLRERGSSMRKLPKHRTTATYNTEFAKTAGDTKKTVAARIFSSGSPLRRGPNKRADTSKLSRRGRDQSKRRLIFVIVAMILVCLNFPVLVDWFSNYRHRENIAAWLEIQDVLQRVKQFGSIDVILVLIGIHGLENDTGLKDKLPRLRSIGETEGYTTLFKESQLLTQYLGSSYMNSNVCQQQEISQAKKDHCFVFSKKSSNFGILSAVSTVQQYIQEANSLLANGQNMNLLDNKYIADTYMMKEILEAKVNVGIEVAKANFKDQLDSYLINKSISFSLILVGCLSLIVTLHYNRWLAPTSRFWRCVARTLSVLPKVVLQQSNFFMKAHFEKLIKTKV